MNYSDIWQFDGLTLIHRFEMTNGKTVRYQSRFTANAVQERITQENGLNNTFTFGQDLCQGIFWKFLCAFNPFVRGLGDKNSPDTANIGVTMTPQFPIQGKRTLAVKTDANIIQAIDEVTLEPKFLFSYSDGNNQV